MRRWSRIFGFLLFWAVSIRRVERTVLLFFSSGTTVLSLLPSNLFGRGYAMLNTLQQLASAAGTVVMLTVFSAVSAKAQAACSVPAKISEAEDALL